MKFTAKQIADILEGQVIGNNKVTVSKLSKIDQGEEDSLSFLSNPKYTSYIYTTKASIVIVNEDFVADKPVYTTLIKVLDAYKAFSTLLEYYNKFKIDKLGFEKPNFIDKSVELGKDLYIGAFAFIGKNVKIKDRVKIYPNAYIGDDVIIDEDTIIFSGAKIYSQTKVGKYCVINSGCVVGSDGFGFSPKDDGTFDKIPQIGNVVIGNYVDIGAGTTIDRATLGSTLIKDGVKLDNQIQIAHNVVIGENTVIAAQSGIAGSTKIGKNCMIGGQVGIVGHITIGDNVRVQAQSGVISNVKNNQVIQGSPSIGYSDFNKSYVHFKNFQSIVKKINDLEKKCLSSKIIE